MRQRKQRLAVGMTVLMLAFGGGAAIGCGDDDNEGAAEEAGKAIDEGAEEAGQEVDEAVDDADKEIGDDDK